MNPQQSLDLSSMKTNFKTKKRMGVVMEYENLFPDLETCKKLQKLGEFGDSVFVWSSVYGDARPILRGELPYMERDNYIAPAPTTDEILAKLPENIYSRGLKRRIMYSKSMNNNYIWKYQMDFGFSNKSNIQALADLYLKLKSEGII